VSVYSHNRAELTGVCSAGIVTGGNSNCGCGSTYGIGSGVCWLVSGSGVC